jgi:hypothetical protein
MLWTGRGWICRANGLAGYGRRRKNPSLTLRALMGAPSLTLRVLIGDPSLTLRALMGTRRSRSGF